MNCLDVQQSLAAYHDGELSDELRARVSEHADRCPECARSLAVFGRLTTIVAALYSPEPPRQLWSEIALQLDEPTLHMASKPQKRMVPKYIAMAASLLMAVGFAWYAIGTWTGHGGHDKFAAEFGHYLEKFHRDPDASQQFLVATYNGQAVTADQAARRVGYRPVVADEMPNAFSLESTYVMSMPCCRDMDSCTCVQTVCRRADGGRISIFEHGGFGHGEDKPELFGDRPTTLAQCSGKACSLVQLDDRVAASWRRGERLITIIGVRDVGEVDQSAAALY